MIRQRPVPPPPVLASSVACSWSAVLGQGPNLLVPDGCLDLAWRDDGTIIVCGPEVEAWSPSLPVGLTAVGVRFRPGVLPLVLRLSGLDLFDRRVGLDALVGDRRARQLSERVGEADDRRSALVDALHPWVLDRWGDVDPVDRGITERVTAERPPSVADVADEFGLSRRQLLRRAERLFGYGPSVLVRLLRFQRFLRSWEAGGPTLAQQAAVAGFSDQSHLTRACREITGLTPSRFLAHYEATFPPMSDPFKTGGGPRDTMPV